MLSLVGVKLENKDILIICIVVIIIALGICCCLALSSETRMGSNDFNIGSNDSFHILLTDNNGNPLINKEIILKVGDHTYKSKTNENGTAIYKLYNSVGSYTVEAIFNGDLGYKSSKMIMDMTISDNKVNSQVNNQETKNFPHYSSVIGYYRSTGIHGDASCIECYVIETQSGHFYVVGGDGSYWDYDGNSIQSSLKNNPCLGEIS